MRLPDLYTRQPKTADLARRAGSSHGCVPRLAHVDPVHFQPIVLPLPPKEFHNVYQLGVPLLFGGVPPRQGLTMLYVLNPVIVDG